MDASDIGLNNVKKEINGQGSTNCTQWRACTHSDERARNVHAKRALVLFEVVIYVCVWKHILFRTIRSEIHNLFQLRNCC